MFTVINSIALTTVYNEFYWSKNLQDIWDSESESYTMQNTDLASAKLFQLLQQLLPTLYFSYLDKEITVLL